MYKSFYKSPTVKASPCTGKVSTGHQARARRFCFGKKGGYRSTMHGERTRRRVSAGLKKRVAYRQHYVCNACKKLLPPTYEVDHIRALFLGGSNHESNLQALCPNCHRDKTQKEQIKTNIKCTECNVVHSPYFVHRCSIKQTQSPFAQFMKK